MEEGFFKKDVKKYSILIKKVFLLFIVQTVYCNAALSLVVLKEIKSESAQQVKLFFDSKINQNQFEVEYLRDIIQLSFKNTSIYPAKIVAGDGNQIKKIFAYQFTPSLVRVRLSVDGNAENYKEKVKIQVLGREIVIEIKSPIVISKPVLSADKEKKLLSEIDKKTKKNSNTKLTGNQKALNPYKGFLWLGVVLFIFFLFLLGFKKLVMNKKQSNQSKFLKRFFIKSLKGEEPQLEVISSHYLGPKKSISVVKIKGKMLVLGVTEESINLISDFESDDGEPSAKMGTGAVSGKSDMSSFNELFDQEVAPRVLDSKIKENTQSGIRDQIKKKVEKLKSL